MKTTNDKRTLAERIVDRIAVCEPLVFGILLYMFTQFIVYGRINI